MSKASIFFKNEFYFSADYAAAMREARESGKPAETKRAKQTIEEEDDTELLSRLVKASKECEKVCLSLIFRPSQPG